MKKLYILISLFALVAKAQIVNIPDANFRNSLNFVDINNDGQIQQSEALLITTLLIDHSNISSFEGIESF
ncbi:MAG: hypothetical protein RL494_1410 [Bacteroidota bacterium]